MSSGTGTRDSAATGIPALCDFHIRRALRLGASCIAWTRRGERM
jgi:hypothetical protein